MSIGIYSALSGLKAKEQELEVVAHNIANVNTAGFKEEQLTFEAVLSRQQPNESPFVDVVEKKVNFTEGPIQTTNNPFDVAIQGEGFFEIQNQDGVFLTRNGAFTPNNNGDLVTTQGFKVMGINGPIQIKSGSKVDISNAGNITVDGQDSGQIKIVQVQDLSKVKSIGEGMFKVESGAQTQLDSKSEVFQGRLEQSNTNVMRGIVKLIDISRQYQSYQKILSNQSKMEQEAVSSLGHIS